MSLKQRIEQALTEAFHPKTLVVTDESHLHAGHSGWREAGETHFKVAIETDAFHNLSRVQQHRLINTTLDFAFREGLHALAITSKASL